MNFIALFEKSYGSLQKDTCWFLRMNYYTFSSTIITCLNLPNCEEISTAKSAQSFV
jgi:hypothetical protein